MLKIYGPGRSRTFRLFWMCKESAIAYEHIPVTINVPNAQSKDAWYLKLNPNGRVPTIDDDGFVMWESTAINLWLAEKYQSPLFPTTIEGKGRMLQWTLYCASDVEAPALDVYHHRFSYPKAEQKPEIADAAEQKLLPRLEVIEKSLDAGHLGYDKWDATDLTVASVLFYLHAMNYDFSKFPRLKSWLAASLSRTAAKEAIALRG